MIDILFCFDLLKWKVIIASTKEKSICFWKRESKVSGMKIRLECIWYEDQIFFFLIKADIFNQTLLISTFHEENKNNQENVPSTSIKSKQRYRVSKWTKTSWKKTIRIAVLWSQLKGGHFYLFIKLISFAMLL